MRNKIIIIVATVVLAASPMFAAYEAYLQIDGIKGETQGARPGWIQLESFSWGMPQGSSAADSVTHTGGQAAGRAEVHDLTFTKRHDTASPAIFQAAMTGKHFRTVVLDVNGQRTLLQDVAITSVQQSGAMADGSVREVVHLSFARDATHQSQSNNSQDWYKVKVKIMANATITGDGAPSPITLRSVRQAGQNSAIIVVCDAAGGMGMAGLQRAFMTKQRIPALTIATRGSENSGKVFPQTQFTFAGATITGNAPMADGCAQMSLNFTRYAGPPMFVAR